MNTPQLTYEINANNEWVHIDSVPNGTKPEIILSENVFLSSVQMFLRL